MVQQFLFTLFLLAIFFAPLGHDLSRYSSYTSLLWNDSSWILLLFFIIWLGFFCVRPKSFPSPYLPYRFLFLAWVLGILISLFFLPTPTRVSAVAPLFFAPLLIWYIATLRNTSFMRILPYAFVGLLLLHGQWAVIQFALQRDVGLAFLGESRLSPNIPAVAKFLVLDTKVVRAYGPYQHANPLGAAMLAGLSVVLVLFQRSRGIYTHRLVGLVPTFFLGLALFLSFSRSAWLGAGLLVVTFLWHRYGNDVRPFQTSFKVNLTFVTMLVVTCSLFIIFVQQRLVDSDDKAWSERARGYSWFVQMFHSPEGAAGIGLGNYAWALKSYLNHQAIAYQPWEIAPVHNALFLLLAEAGIVLTFVWLGFLVWSIYLLWPRSMKVWLFFIPFLPLILLDHYVLSLPSSLVIILLAMVLVLEKETGSFQL